MNWWQRLRDSTTGSANPARPGETRWVVLDVETSGLDPRHDQLLAIAAIGLRIDWARKQMDIRLGDSFEVVLKQAQASSRDNILLHGIGVRSQQQGVEPALALRAFADYAGTAPLLAFHSAFDETLIGRFCQQHLGQRLSNDWLDIEDLCAVTHEHVRARSLDEWMDHFGITCPQRHQAAADTLAESELLLRIWPEIARQCQRWRDVTRLAAHRRWLPA